MKICSQQDHPCLNPVCS